MRSIICHYNIPDYHNVNLKIYLQKYLRLENPRMAIFLRYSYIDILISSWILILYKNTDVWNIVKHQELC